jgi:hypothetical protein
MTITAAEKKTAIILDEWSLIQSRRDWDGYQAPELLPIHLHGRIRRDVDSRFVAGKCIETSGVVETSGRYARTRGKARVYRLGKIHRGYLEWIKANGYHYDCHTPFKKKWEE